MKKKHQVHNLIILDESGSMGVVKSTIIQGFNEVVQTIKGIEEKFPEQEHSISLVSFNGMGQKVLHFNDPASKLEEIDSTRYQPNFSTPLYDAIGFSINKLSHSIEGQTGFNVLVTILTDGAENSSTEFSGSAVKKQIEQLKQNNWTFTYIGADHNVEEMAFTLSINNTLKFNKNEADIAEMFAKERSSRASYSQKIRDKQNTTDDYFGNEEENK